MKNVKIGILSLLSIALLTSFISPKDGYTLTVNIKDISNNKGKIWVAVYNSSSTYMKKQLYGKSATISGQKAQVVFNNVPAGTYAVSTFHDENSNDKLDTNGLGIPKEDYGFSNNPNAMFGPPSYNKASFKVNADTSISISLD